jgi:hypothetical protein
MRNLTSASETTTRALASAARRAWLLSVFSTLLLVGAPHGAGLARAQERKPADANVPSMSMEEVERLWAAAALPRPMINVKPFEDLALTGKRLVDEGKLGPDTTLDVSATAELMGDGRLRPETVQVFWLAPTDETLAQLTQQLLTAVSESRMLGALEGAKSVRLGLKLDRQNVSVLVASEMPSADKAGKFADGYNILVRTGAEVKRGMAEGTLYERLRFTSDGKVFKMSFEMPRAEAGRMIADMLEKRATKAAPRGRQ